MRLSACLAHLCFIIPRHSYATPVELAYLEYGAREVPVADHLVTGRRTGVGRGSSGKCFRIVLIVVLQGNRRRGVSDVDM